MSDELGNAQPKGRMRSPAYPSFGLGEAIKRAHMVWDAVRKNDGHVDSVIHAMGYNGANGASLRAVGAMNHYGIFEESGAKGNRRIRLSELALDILHLPEEDEKRVAALKISALKPTIHQILWERYQQTLPKDDVIKGFLVRERNYGPEAASDVIRNYRDSFLFARLNEVTDSKPANGGEEEPSVVTQVQNPLQTEVARTPISGPATAHLAPLLPQSNLQAGPSIQELPILVDHGQVARIPFPMSEDAFDLLIGTLQLWKKKLITPQTSAASTPMSMPPEGGGTQS